MRSAFAKLLLSLFLVVAISSDAAYGPWGGGGGGGGVSSVGLSAAPSSVFNISGSPVTSSGTLALSMDNQNPNVVMAGPTTGSAAAPAFRALVAADLPAAALTSAHLFVGNGSNIATDVAVTGDIGITNAGVTSISSGVIINADVNASAAIAFSKLATLTSGNLLVGSAGNVPTSVALSGAVTLIADGTTSYAGTVPVNKGGTNVTSYTAGDLIYASGTTTLSKLGIGTALQVLRTNAGATAPEWATLTAGDFSGPASSAANAAVRFSGTGGKTGLNSDFIIDDISANSVTVHSPNNATVNATAAPDLVVKAANKTAGTGNGGTLFVYGGVSAGGSDGSVFVGYSTGAGTASSVQFRYDSGNTQIRVPSQESNSVPAISFGTNNNNGIGKNTGNEMVVIAGGAASMYFDAGYAQPISDLISVASSVKSFGAITGSALFPFKYGYFADSLGIGIAQGGTLYTPNYHVDIRQRTASTAVYEQFTITTTTGLTSADGTKIGLDASGNAVINQQENLAIKFFTNGTEAWNITNGGVLANKVGANESTGAGIALFGANSPASTLTAPYTWLTVQTSDGSTGYVPIWK